MKQFIRNFNKQKVVGTLNICSLSLSIMVSIVGGLWAINELTCEINVLVAPVSHNTFSTWQ